MSNVIKLFSDNHNGTVMSKAQYNEERLQMSTGDFHTHKIEPVKTKPNPRLKTAAKHLANYKKVSRVWKKSEIGAVIKLLNSKNFHGVSGDMAVVGAIENLESYFEYGHAEERKITREQSKYGIDYLRSRYFKKTGEPRKGCPFGTREIAILKSFSKFRWVGLRPHQNAYGSYRWHTPVYRVYSKDGSYFDYTAVHWGTPEILN